LRRQRKLNDSENVSILLYFHQCGKEYTKANRKMSKNYSKNKMASFKL
jgi:hypothetical protein